MADAAISLVRDGRRCATVDFGCTRIGGAEYDRVVAGGFLFGSARGASRSAGSLDKAAWDRAHRQALRAALSNGAGRVLRHVVAEHEAEA